MFTHKLRLVALHACKLNFLVYAHQRRRTNGAEFPPLLVLTEQFWLAFHAHGLILSMLA